MRFPRVPDVLLRWWPGKVDLRASHKLHRAIAFCSWESNAFFYQNAKPIANLKGKRPEVVANDAKKVLPLFETWQDWRGEFKPGYFTYDDLMVVRR